MAKNANGAGNGKRAPTKKQPAPRVREQAAGQGKAARNGPEAPQCASGRGDQVARSSRRRRRLEYCVYANLVGDSAFPQGTFDTQEEAIRQADKVYEGLRED